MTAAPRNADPTHTYDIIVVGAHLAGSLLATILARQGVSVLLARTGQEDAQAAGETTVPYTAEVFSLLARRYGVPEIGAFGLASQLPPEVRRTSGVKRSLGFLYHRAGRDQDPREAVQFNVPGEHTEWHLYRPDVDAYATSLAIRYGAAVTSPDSAVADIRADEQGAGITLADQTAYRARYVVDGSGPESPLLRAADPAGTGGPALLHRSSVLSTHMRGVLPFETVAPLSGYRHATPWSHGTLHHLFDGGWLQVVHFGNHPDAANELCSVTASIDPQQVGGSTPEESFWGTIGKFPSLARQFARATAVGAWHAETVWQRSAGPAAGPRYFLLERTATRNDMFLSRDVTTAAEVVHALAAALIGAARTGDWSAPALKQAGAFQDTLTVFNDRILAAARGACADFPLWNAFSRVWLLWQILAALSLKQARNACLDNSGGRPWREVELYDRGALWFPAPEGLDTLMAEAFDQCVAVRDGAAAPGPSADRIFELLRRAEFVPPLYKFADPRARYYHFTLARRVRMLLWAKTVAPPEFRRMLTKENISAVPPAVI